MGSELVAKADSVRDSCRQVLCRKGGIRSQLMTNRHELEAGTVQPNEELLADKSSVVFLRLANAWPDLMKDHLFPTSTKH